MAYGSTNAQIIASSKLVEFNQLVKNECITNKTYGSLGVYSVLDNNYVGVANHKYFVKAKVSGFSGNWNMRYKLSGETDEVFIANNSETSQSVVFTAQYNFSELDIYPISSGITIDGLMVIDLTSLFGSGQEPDLTTCQALFNAPYYAYTSSANMQLIYDGQKPIALCDLPMQEPTLLWTNPSPSSSFASTTLTGLDLRGWKYLIFEYCYYTSFTSTEISKVGVQAGFSSTCIACLSKQSLQNNEVASRRLDITSSSQIVVRDAYLYNTDTNTKVVNNTFIIPTAIYGTNTL